MTLIEAIAKMEGFGIDSYNLPTRHKNPGDICAGQWANAHGAIPGAADPRWPAHGPSRYAVFPSVVDGWRALRLLLRIHYSGMTLADAIAKYAPATENETERYVKCVCEWTGLTPQTVVSEEVIG